MDTGIGMSQEYLEKIFESFSRERMTSSKISGTGLGMAIVKKYVDLLGGTIDVKSVLGKGSTFIVTLKYKMADEKYYLNNKEKCSSGIDFLYFDMLIKKHGGKRNGGNVLFSMPADRS